MTKLKPNKFLTEDQGSYILLFGKYKGEDIEEIPPTYLQWCLDEMNDLPEDVIEKIQEYAMDNYSTLGGLGRD